MARPSALRALPGRMAHGLSDLTLGSFRRLASMTVCMVLLFTDFFILLSTDTHVQTSLLPSSKVRQRTNLTVSF
jgi:hypothetical protein